MKRKKNRKASLLRALLLSSTVTLALQSAAYAAIADPNYTRPLLDPATQLKWLTAIPNALMAGFTYTPHSAVTATAAGFPAGVCGVTEDCYTISARMFQQNLGLVDELTKAPMLTTVYGYGTATNAPGGVAGVGSIWHSPAPTIKSTSNRPYRVTWLNELPNIEPPGHDPTIDGGPNAAFNYPYNRIVTHMHGAHVEPHSDGYPEAWFSPGFAKKGTTFRPSLFGPEGTYRYINTQEAATTWYHDHASGLTHINTQMGMAGFSPITDDNEKCLQGLAPGVAGVCGAAVKVLPTDPFEIGFALQDRTFWPDGSIAMPDQPVRDLLSASCKKDALGITIPTSCPIVPFSKAPDGHLITYDPTLADTEQRGPYAATNTTLEYFGNMPMVNGVVYGKFDVEPRWYRMRLIGGTDSRTWVIKLVNRTTGLTIPMWQIGSEQGFLNTPVDRTTGIDLMPGERVDVLVDFRAVTTPGTKIVMQNVGPDIPYQGPNAVPALAASTVIPEIMEFNSLGTAGLTATPDVAPLLTTNLRPVSLPVAALTTTVGTPVRNVSLIEITDNLGRTMPTVDARGFMPMGVPITEQVKLNDVEEWDIINTTMDAHPMHLHLVAFQLINRQTFDPLTFVAPVTNTTTGVYSQPAYTATGVAATPAAWEAGWKDTIDCPPGYVTRVKAKFDIDGLYVWHCHILSHEEHDMMRAFKVNTPAKIGVFRGGQWYLDANGNKLWDAGVDTTPAFGAPGDIPVTGDWNGDGKTKVGVVRGNTWFLDKNGNGTFDAGDLTYSFGIPGDTYVTGDWTGNGITKIGAVRGNVWYLDMNGNGIWDAGDVSFTFGLAGDTFITGDWDGSGKTKIGVIRGNTWMLDVDGDGVLGAGDAVFAFGVPGDVWVTGDWNGDGRTKAGAVRGNTWFMDTNGNRAWDLADGSVGFGAPGDLPVTGKW
jgi:FtsP/CotA-like multicopper oxidase with cupredoxin domain